MSENIYNISVKKIGGQQTTLQEYKNKVLLIVNVASKCGLTPQYDGLEKIYKKYHGQGFEVLGFPANEFGAQEPGTNEEIQQFCQLNFKVDFPMFSKVVVKGAGQHPLYQYLTETKPTVTTKPESKYFKGDKGRDIQWNFEKFLVDQNGEIIERFAPDVTPEDPVITQAIEKALNRH